MYKTFIKNVSDIVLVLKKSFIELLPYMVIMSFLIVSIQLITIFNLDLNTLKENLVSFVVTIGKFLPILIIIAISVNLSKKYKLNITISTFSSLLVFVLFNLLNNNFKFELNGLLTIYTIVIPFLTIKYLNELLKMDIFKSDIIINSSLKDIFSLIMPFVIVVLTTSIFLYYVNISLEEYIFVVNNYIIMLPDEIFLFLYSLFSGLFWFIGIHGVTAASLFFDTAIMQNDILPNISNSNFMNLFTEFGGAGAGLSLVIAILINGRDEHWKKISKLSLPFVIFNINEILIYGLPIIFNKYLFLPFIFVPLINFILAYNIISLGIFEFSMQDVHWAIPIFANSYLSTNGDIGALLLQIFLLGISVMIYLPFINMYVNSQNKDIIEDNLQTSLSIKEYIGGDSGFVENNEQINLIKKNTKLNKIIDMIHKSELLLYYQPKINIRNKTCDNLEALLRIKLTNGEISDPYFLKYLEDDDLIKIIDFWVVKEVKRQIDIWKKDDFEPIVSMNLHPTTLGDNKIITDIIKIFKYDNVQFEIIEKSFLNEKAKEHIDLLHDSGCQLAIDDFGVGYTSLSTLYETPISIVKFDKSLIDLIDKENPFKVCSDMANLCCDLGFDLVAEGVETKVQLDIIKRTKIKYVQGFYFSDAKPAHLLKDFCKDKKFEV